MVDINYNVERFDLTKDNSLQAWSAADEYLLQVVNESESKPNHLGIYNDRFGFLTCNLNSLKKTVVVTNKSQEKAISKNANVNKIALPEFLYPLLNSSSQIDLALIKIPKSLDLFQLFLDHISNNSTDDVTVICSFMTRHFTTKYLEIAEEYFESVEQSRAVKKARLLVLNKKKASSKKELLTTVEYKEEEYKQYPGIFSAAHIDYATQFLLEHVEVSEDDSSVLDLGSGNGIIGKEISKVIPEAIIHLIDDSYLAVESAKLNLTGKNIYHHYENNLSGFEENTFDLIVTNPPFHFEYEINIQISLALFKEAHKCLKTGGNLQLVANKHLNYKVHLQKYFSAVNILAENEKFVVYKCVK